MDSSSAPTPYRRRALGCRVCESELRVAREKNCGPHCVRFSGPYSETRYFTHMFAAGWVDAPPIVITTFTFPGLVAVGTIVFTWNTPEFNPGAAPA
jgi:hypothetical protein